MEFIDKILLDSPSAYIVHQIKSENIFKDNKGFLILRDAQIARDGEFIYSGADIYGPKSKYAKEQIILTRPTEEVFSEKTMASVNTAVVTNNHPAEVNVSSVNGKYTIKGSVLGNVRRADYQDEYGNNLLLADLMITDESLIQEIENGKRELSIGYRNTMKPVKGDPLKFISTDLRINHIAVVTKGRAITAFIKDSNDDFEEIHDINLGDNNIIDIKGGELMDRPEHATFKFRHDGEIIEVSGAILKDQAQEIATEIVRERKEKNKKEDK